MLLTGAKRTGLAKYLAESGISDRSLPEIAGCFSRGLVVCGDAAGVWDDLERFGCRSDRGRRGGVAKDGFDFLMVNKIGETFPGVISHWYSNAGHLIAIWRAARRQEYEREFQGPLWTHSCTQGAAWQWPWTAAGTSGLGGVLTGVALGYTQVVLCGLPLDDGPHNGEPPWRATKFASSEAAAADGGPDQHWQRAIAAFKGAVFSMSGRTRDWFGEPR